MIVKPVRVIPGLPEGANLWINYLRNKLAKLNFKEAATGIFRDKGLNEELQTFMDDILIGTDNELTTIHEKIQTKVNLDVLEEGLPTRYCGLPLKQFSEKHTQTELSMDSYVESLQYEICQPLKSKLSLLLGHM